MALCAQTHIDRPVLGGFMIKADQETWHEYCNVTLRRRPFDAPAAFDGGPMFPTLWISKTGLAAQQTNHATIFTNLTNVNTNGFTYRALGSCARATCVGNGAFVTAAAAGNTGSGTLSLGQATGDWDAGRYRLVFTQAAEQPLTSSVLDGADTVASGTYVSGAYIQFNGAEVTVTDTLQLAAKETLFNVQDLDYAEIAWLCFPGTTTLPHVDWVVGDDFMFPPELEPWFSERPLRLPTLFQTSDSQLPMNATPERAALGLPEGRFVYCALNKNNKIKKERFESWMRILRTTNDSVLCLLADNPWAQDNLRHAARAHGISSERLIFAGRVTPADYLGPFAAADLFLDTWRYNAGTTANDALWPGLPILTLSGRTYASRMTGSTLNSLGLRGFITDNRDDYELRAISYESSNRC
jgi:hypothetical protein